MAQTYLTGEEIRSGDHVLFHGEPGQIEFVASREGSQTAWYAEHFGGGFMIRTPTFGRVFVSQADEDLEFVARSSDGTLH